MGCAQSQMAGADSGMKVVNVDKVKKGVTSVDDVQIKMRGEAGSARYKLRRCNCCSFSYFALCKTCPRCNDAAPVVRKPIVGGNWKCNPSKVSELKELVANIDACDTSGCDVYVCPSTLHIGIVYKSFKNGAKVAPQNCNYKGCGAYTGEMSADQMVDMGLEWCLIGHSERRGEFGLPTPPESNSLLAMKCKYLLEKGMKVIFAIGEPLPVREKGLKAVMENLIPQLLEIKGMLDPARVVLAYEPVWSIGTGVTASPAQAQETHRAIRQWIAKEVSPSVAAQIRIQYGGSANAKNAPDLSKCPDVDGFLVGGASLKPEISEIVAAVAKEKCWRDLGNADLFPAAVYEKSGLRKTGAVTWVKA